jgi:hypothetical protein
MTWGAGLRGHYIPRKVCRLFKRRFARQCRASARDAKLCSSTTKDLEGESFSWDGEARLTLKTPGTRRSRAHRQDACIVMVTEICQGYSLTVTVFFFRLVSNICIIRIVRISPRHSRRGGHKVHRPPPTGGWLPQDRIRSRGYVATSGSTPACDRAERHAMRGTRVVQDVAETLHSPASRWRAPR